MVIHSRSLARRLSLLALSAAAPAIALAQASSPTMPPLNDLPNPSTTDTTWAKLPAGRMWGATSAVAIDRDGKSIWMADRCAANSCVNSALDPVMKFDANGNVVAHFGGGMFASPHGILVDKDGNIWVVDCACTGGGGRRGGGGARGASGVAPRPAPAGAGRGADSAAPPKGHQIFEFSPDGKPLRTLGKPGGARDPDYFFQPNAILIAPNGDIFVAEGHSSAPGSAARVYKFSKDGTLIKAWGQFGNGPDDFDQPHALAMDSKGRLFVGDRGNNRIKIFDQDGKLLDTWYQFSRPSGIFIDAQDNMYVADSESGSVNPAHGAWKRGIRIGSAKDGSVKYFIPDPAANATNTSSAEGVAVDAAGHIYGAEVGPPVYGEAAHLKRYTKP
jgi:sugar lactone lactonase YvrE